MDWLRRRAEELGKAAGDAMDRTRSIAPSRESIVSTASSVATAPGKAVDDAMAYARNNAPSREAVIASAASAAGKAKVGFAAVSKTASEAVGYVRENVTAETVTHAAKQGADTVSKAATETADFVYRNAPSRSEVADAAKAAGSFVRRCAATAGAAVGVGAERAKSAVKGEPAHGEFSYRVIEMPPPGHEPK